jgi:hypothetical protein
LTTKPRWQLNGQAGGIPPPPVKCNGRAEQYQHRRRSHQKAASCSQHTASPVLVLNDKAKAISGEHLRAGASSLRLFFSCSLKYLNVKCARLEEVGSIFSRLAHLPGGRSAWFAVHRLPAGGHVFFLNYLCSPAIFISKHQNMGRPCGTGAARGGLVFASPLPRPPTTADDCPQAVPFKSCASPGSLAASLTSASAAKPSSLKAPVKTKKARPRRASSLLGFSILRRPQSFQVAPVVCSKAALFSLPGNFQILL